MIPRIVVGAFAVIAFPLAVAVVVALQICAPASPEPHSRCAA